MKYYFQNQSAQKEKYSFCIELLSCQLYKKLTLIWDISSLLKIEQYNKNVSFTKKSNFSLLTFTTLLILNFIESCSLRCSMEKITVTSFNWFSRYDRLLNSNENLLKLLGVDLSEPISDIFISLLLDRLFIFICELSAKVDVIDINFFVEKNGSLEQLHNPISELEIGVTNKYKHFLVIQNNYVKKWGKKC